MTNTRKEVMNLKKVFVVNDSGHDFAQAKVYGELTTLSHGLVDRFNVMAMLRTFEPVLENSSPEDYILHTGPGVMSAVACAVFAAKHGRLNLLLWRAERDGNDRYVHRKLLFKKGER